MESIDNWRSLVFGGREERRDCKASKEVRSEELVEAEGDDEDSGLDVVECGSKSLSAAAD